MTPLPFRAVGSQDYYHKASESPKPEHLGSRFPGSRPLRLIACENLGTLDSGTQNFKVGRGSYC